jgi:hypothetical protein
VQLDRRHLATRAVQPDVDLSTSKPPAPLLREALESDGGLGCWGQFRGVASTIVVGGGPWRAKGIEMDRTPRRTTSEFRRQWSRQAPFGNPDWTMTWTPQHVEIVDRDGRVIACRSDGRNAFDRSFDARWDPLNLAYFNGYAMWTYHAAPFVLAAPGYESSEIAAIEYEGGTLRGVSVRFPESVHTHSREQRFYFDEDGLLRRHDYEVDVWANASAAHFLSDYVAVAGLKFPTRRSVFARNLDGTPNLELNLVTIELSDYTLF